MIVEEHFTRLKERFRDAAMVSNADGSWTVTVPEVPLKAGWNRTATDVAFLVPAGYPLASPDCFWVAPGLALAHGGPPKNTGFNGAPNVPPDWLWFSWHPSRWDPQQATLETYINVIRQRFADPQ